MNQPAKHLQPVIARLRANDFVGALSEAEGALGRHSDDAVLLGLAALSALRVGNTEHAVSHLQRQLALTPGDAAARFNLVSALTGLGRHTEALAAVSNYDEHPKLARIAGYLHQEAGQTEEAIGAYEAALAKLPDDWETWNNLANCRIASGMTEAAITAFENAINHSPGNSKPEIFLNLAQALGAVENRDKRLNTAEEAHRRFPDHAKIQLELGLARAAAGLMEGAEEMLKRAADAETSFDEARLELGLLYETTNRLDELDAHIAECEKLGSCAKLNFLQAWSMRRHDRYEEAQVLAAQIPDTINPIRTAQLRAEIADRLGNYDEAFRQYSLMNEASVAARPQTPGPSYRETIVAQTGTMGPPLEAWQPALASRTPADPVFIVGSPRSGTTLLDTLLGALPELQVFEEMPMLAEVENEFPDLANQTDAGILDAARQRYFWLATKMGGEAGGRRIVDKMPLLLTHMPIISRLFPDAAIILVERHPCDVVLSCYMANFTLNRAMRSYTNLEEAARTYDAIFENWHKARKLLPLDVHHVRYERMVADLEGEMRPLISFLGLPWRDEVLDNQASAARRGLVRTASYSQIGQPLYTRSAGRWERYRRYLEPVIPILTPWVEKMGYLG